MKGIIGDMSEICCNFTDSKIYKNTPELARDGSIGGFFVKLQKDYLSEKQLIRYFELTCKGFIFESFYDKKFTDAFKSLIKTPDEFERFLEMIHLDAEEFIHIAIYISPQSFTSNLVKFLKENYVK